VQVVRPEVSQVRQRHPVEDIEDTLADGDQAFGPEILKRAVDVDIREPQGLAEVALGDGLGAGVTLGQTCSPGPQHHLAEEMGHPARRLPLRHVDHRLAIDRGVDQGQAPELIRDPGARVTELPKGIVRQVGQSAAGDRPDVAVQDLEMKTVEVGHVAGDVEHHDLPHAAAGQLGYAGHPLGQQEASRGSITLTSDCLVRGHIDEPDRYLADGRLLGRSEVEQGLELGKERISCSWRSFSGTTQVGSEVPIPAPLPHPVLFCHALDAEAAHCSPHVIGDLHSPFWRVP